MKLVCRRWRYLVETYAAKLTRVLCIVPFCQAEGVGASRVFQWCAWDNEAASWRRMPPIDFLPRMPSLVRCEWMATHRGLVMVECVNWLSTSPRYFICNPCTRKFCELPRYPYKDLQSMGLSSRALGFSVMPVHLRVDSSGQSYVVLALAGCLTTELDILMTYESASKAWSVRQTTRRPDTALFYCGTGHSVIVVNGVMYGLVHREPIQAIVALDTPTGVWRRVCSAVPGSRALLQSGDRIMCVCHVGGVSSIYALDVESSTMVLESEPDQGLAHLVREPDVGRYFSCNWEFKTAAHDGFVYIFSVKTGTGIMYDTSTKVW